MPDTSTPNTPAQPTHWLARQFNLPLPVLQAPMAGVQDHVLALAVARSGGLGAIPAAMLSPAALGAELAAFRAASTAPLNVNFFCHTPPAPDATVQARWLAALQPCFQAWGVDPATIDNGPGRLPFADDTAELAAACNQLLLDSAESITEDIVDRYYGGRVETNAFKVADAALAGRAGEAMALLRHALATGADPVPLVAAISMKIRQMAKIFGNRSASPASLGMAPWQLDRARKDLTGWTDDGLAAVIQAMATADAAAKGAERDPIYSLEKLVNLIAHKGIVQSK